MSVTSDELLYFSDDTFFKRVDETLIPLDVSDISNLKSFHILVDDRYFFYDGIDLELAGKRKTHDIVRNYLLVSYPEEMIEVFKLITAGDKQLIAIPSEALMTAVATYSDVFKKARKTSSPFIELCCRHQQFLLSGLDTPVEWNNGTIVYDSVASDLSCFSKEDILLSDKPVTQDIQLMEKRSGFQWAGAFKVPIMIVCIAYLLFLTGEILRYQKVKSYKESANTMLQKQYMKAGVAGKADPYGLLLFKAKGKKSPGKITVLPLIEKLGDATGKPQIQGLSYKNGMLRFEGVIENFTVLEEFKKDLGAKINSTVQVTDTKKEGDQIHFSMRVEI